MDTDSITTATAAAGAALSLPGLADGDLLSIAGFVLAILALSVRLLEAIPPAVTALRAAYARVKK